MKRNVRHEESGWVWTGILIGCVVMISLFYMFWPPAPPALIAKTTTDLQNITGAAEQFRIVAGRYPTNLNEMVSNETGQIFIDFHKRAPKGTNDGEFLDPWMRRYIFVPPMTAGSTGYVASLGKDGVAGGVGADADRFVVLTNFSSAMRR